MAAETKYGTYINVFEITNFRGRTNDYGTLEYPSLTNTPTGNWDKKIRSLYTGESTWTEMFDQPNFKGNVLRLGPSTAIADLGKESFNGINFSGRIASYRIYGTRPENWPGSSVSDRRQLTLSDLQLTSPNGLVKTMAFDVVGMIPEVGSVLESVLNYAFPEKKKYDDPWVEMQRWMTKLLGGVVDDLAVRFEQDKIEALAAQIRECAHNPTEARFQTLYTNLLMLQPSFFNPVSPASILPQLTLFGTVALAIHRVAYFDFDRIYTDKPKEADRQGKLQNLLKAIDAFRASVKKGLEDALSRRLKKITITRHDNTLRGGHFKVLDDYTHWSEYCEFDHNREADAQKDRANKSVAHCQEYATWTFDAEFAVYREISNIWSYFSLPEPREKMSYAYKRVEARFGMYGGVETHKEEHSSNYKYMNFYPIEGAITKMTIVSVDYSIVGLMYESSGSVGVTRIGRTTKPSKKAWWYEELDATDSSRFTAMVGAWGDTIHQMTFRVQRFDGNSAGPNAIGYPRHAGSTLGRDHGHGVALSGPDGSTECRLIGFFGQIDKNGYLAAIGLIFNHNQVQPYQ